MKRVPTAVALGILALCASAPAAVLLPASIAPTALQAPGPTPPVSTLNSGYNVGGALVGTVSSYVVSGDPANPFGGLSFYYQVLNLGTEPVGRVTISGTGFGTAPVDVERINVSWNGSVPGGTAPVFADRAVSGHTVGFDFLAGTQIPSPGWSQMLVVHTSAPAFTTGIGGVIDNTTANVSVLVPIPEPGAMLMLGFAALTVLGKRHRN